MLLDSRLAFDQILLTQLSNVWYDSIRLLERVLPISHVYLILGHRSRLTTAARSSEYIS
jgi:hypothetical protein